MFLKKEIKILLVLTPEPVKTPKSWAVPTIFSNAVILAEFTPARGLKLLTNDL
jgi:hypothetical protein